MASSAVDRTTFDAVMVPNYAPGSMVPVRGHGARVWDQAGREYVDFGGGIAVSSLGHTHPAVVEALVEQGRKLWHVANIHTNEPALRLAARLVALTFAERVFLANSGAEANEAALKLARKHAHDRALASGTGAAAPTEIVAFDNAFHGRTLFTVSVGGQPKYTEGFGPLPRDIVHLPFNDLAAARERISAKTCAVIVEPVQGESGVVAATPAFLAGLRELCTRHGALLIFDEVQSGAGRTGPLFHYMSTGVTPDILTTAKGLGGGFPIGAMLTTAAIAASFNVGSHGSTYGGNPLACAVALAVLDELTRPQTQENALARTQQLRRGLDAINRKHGIFQEIRASGLWFGCELVPAWMGRAKAFVKAAEEQGLIILVAGTSVIRLAPSLLITDADVKAGLERLELAVSRLTATERELA